MDRTTNHILLLSLQAVRSPFYLILIFSKSAKVLKWILRLGHLISWGHFEVQDDDTDMHTGLYYLNLHDFFFFAFLTCSVLHTWLLLLSTGLVRKYILNIKWRETFYSLKANKSYWVSDHQTHIRLQDSAASQSLRPVWSVQVNVNNLKQRVTLYLFGLFLEVWICKMIRFS